MFIQCKTLKILTKTNFRFRKENPLIAVRCKQHPKYMAKRQPRVACWACWYMWKIRRLLTKGIYEDLEEVTPKKLRKENT